MKQSMRDRAPTTSASQDDAKAGAVKVYKALDARCILNVVVDVVKSGCGDRRPQGGGRWQQRARRFVLPCATRNSAAVSYGQLRRDLGRPGDASALVEPLYTRRTEGRDTADQRDTQRVLDACG
jgi:hypothetical protein